MTHAMLEQLRSKYAQILQMRLEDISQAGEESCDAVVRAHMASLARRFPGALREADDLEVLELQARIAQVEAALAGHGQVEPWMRATELFHRLTRGVLYAKGWLRGRKEIEPATREAYIADASRNPLGDEALAWAGELDRIARPPRGRVTDLVYQRMAVELSLTTDEAKALVFGLPRRQRR